jgi:8-oxo-dGTP diphosphatase
MGLTQGITALEEGVCWKAVNSISKGELPFDHDNILHTALTRLQGKLRYTNIARALLPETFRIEELQSVYEAILNRSLNRTNFRMKLLKIGMLEQVSILSNAVGIQGGRPPHVYRFTQDLVEAVDRDFL